MTLLPCPHCGAISDGGTVCWDDDVPNGNQSVVCDMRFGGCGSSGPHYARKEDAAAGWNRRIAEVKQETLR